MTPINSRLRLLGAAVVIPIPGLVRLTDALKGLLNPVLGLTV